MPARGPRTRPGPSLATAELRRGGPAAQAAAQALVAGRSAAVRGWEGSAEPRPEAQAVPRGPVGSEGPALVDLPPQAGERDSPEARPGVMPGRWLGAEEPLGAQESPGAVERLRVEERLEAVERLEPEPSLAVD